MHRIHSAHIVLCLVSGLLGDHSEAYWRGVMAVSAVRLEQPVAQVSVTAPAQPLRQFVCCGAKWCRPCQLQHAQVDKLELAGFIVRDWSERLPSHVRMIDADRHSEVVSQLRVKQIPTVLLLEDGRVIGRYTRVLKAKEMSRMLNGRGNAI